MLLGLFAVARVRQLPKAPAACAVSVAAPDCSWSSVLGACTPSACAPTRCGVLRCSCEAPPLHEQTPWDILQLDPKLAFSPIDVKSAFLSVAHELQPDKNPACRELAGVTFVAARQARDTLLKLTTSFGDPEARVMASSMIADKASTAELARPAPALQKVLRLARSAVRSVTHSAGEWLRRVKDVLKQSLSYYWRYPAVFILGAIGLQCVLLSLTGVAA